MKRLWTNRYVKFFLQLTVSLAALWWLGCQLGARELAEVFIQMDVRVFVLGCGVYIMTQLISAWRWQVVARVFGFGIGWWRAAQLYFLGMFYNIFLPTGYGGDVVRTLYLAPNRRPPSRVLAALTVMLDRLGGLAALLVLGGVAAWWMRAELGLWGQLMLAAGVLGLAGAVLLVGPLSRWRRLPRRVRFIFLTLRWRTRAMWKVGLLSLGVQALNVVIYAAIFCALGAQVSWPGITLGYAAVTLATLLPVSVGGLGVREGGWAAVMLALGQPAELGVSGGLIYFFVQTLCSVLGLWPFFTLKNEIKHETFKHKIYERS